MLVSTPVAVSTTFILMLIWLACFIHWRMLEARESNKVIIEESPEQKHPKGAYACIEPLPDFSWQTTVPQRIRPFKPKYHLTMALENIAFSDFIAVDKTYLNRIQLRRDLMAKHRDAMLACNPTAQPAVLELYSWMFGTYLPRRFPSMFKIVDEPSNEKHHQPTRLKNLVVNEEMPLTPSSAMTALHTLGSHVDTDLLLLLPSTTSPEGQPIYHLEAFVTCFPSGFSTPAKLSKPLAEIHQPVPGYAAKLERSMDRFFAKLEVGKIVRRANWTVTTTPDLFLQSGSHMYKSAAGNEQDAGNDDAVERERNDVDIDMCRLRSERQTLHRLPETKALVFAFKTYQSTLADVKADGDGLALADAIEGLGQGNVPEMSFYKRGVIWADKVVEYLRS